MIDASTGSIVIRTKAGAPGDSEAGATDIDGELALDTANSRLYWRTGAAWHYADQDAGFCINALEKNCPICGKLIKVGDAIAGVIEGEKPDGSPHGIYCHMACLNGETEGIALPKKVDVDALLPRGKSMPSAKERREKGLEKVAV